MHAAQLSSSHRYGVCRRSNPPLKPAGGAVLTERVSACAIAPRAHVLPALAAPALAAPAVAAPALAAPALAAPRAGCCLQACSPRSLL